MYPELLKDLISIRKVILIAAGIFLLGIVLGIAYHASFDQMMLSFMEMAKRITTRRGISLMAAIFLRNSLSSLIAIVSGYIFGIFPAFSALSNGVIIGVTMTHLEASKMTLALLLLIPHGIFELPAMFISWGLGIWRGISLLRQSQDQLIQERQIKAWKIYFYIIIPLLIIAAVIEGTMIGIVSGG